MPGPIRDGGEAAKALEATLLRQMLSASGAFKGNDVAGSKLHAEMFIETLADAIAKSGGLGLAALIERSLPAEEMADKAAGAGPGLPQGKVTSGFGQRLDPFDGEAKFHTGIDLSAKVGAPIHATAAGVVRSAGPRGGYGNAVEIDHGNGLTTLYAHASSLAVKPGDRVERGDVIGEVGATGRATGPHLHFEVRNGGRPIDPKNALKAYEMRADNLIGGKPGQGF